MTTLFKHVLDGMEENQQMSGLDTLCEGLTDGQEAIDIFGENYEGDMTDEEMLATIKALDVTVEANEISYYEPKSQVAIKTWNETVWGQDFGSDRGSEPFGG